MPVLGIEPADLPVVDVRAQLGWARPARYSPRHQPVVHRLSHHPQPDGHRRQRQPLIDLQPPQRPDIGAHPRPSHHQPPCHERSRGVTVGAGARGWAHERAAAARACGPSLTGRGGLKPWLA
jgi:hypothetical protein